MGTSAFVGVVESSDLDSEFRARVVNSDGYPDHLGPTLGALWARFDSVEYLLDVLIHEHREWSGLDANQAPDFIPLCPDGYVVPGVGVAYEGVSEDAWVTGRLGDSIQGCSSVRWGYLFCVELEEMVLVHVSDGCPAPMAWFSYEEMVGSQASAWLPYLYRR